MKNNNRLPKEGWYVQNDGSQMFKDIVIKFLNESPSQCLDGSFISANYEITYKNSIDIFLNKESFGPNAKQLSIDEFINLTSEIMEDKKIVGYNVKEEFKEFANKLFVDSFSPFNRELFDCDFNPNTTIYNLFVDAKVLDIWCDPVYEEEKYEGWCVVTEGDDEWLVEVTKHIDHHYYYSYIFEFEKGENYSESHGYGSNDWINVSGRKIRKATNEDLVKYLSIAANKKGFKEGVRVKGFFDDVATMTTNNFRISSPSPAYLVTDNGLTIFSLETCNWAEIIKDEPPEINGRKGTIEGELVNYNNCAKFDIKFFKDLIQINDEAFTSKIQNRRIEKITLQTGVEITMKQIKQIVDAYNNLKK